MIINIGSMATPDLPIAQALASRFNGYLIWGQVDLSQIPEDIIIVGGQEANQTYNWLVQQGHIPSLKAETTGFGSIFYLKLFNRNIRVITGWNVEDTEAAGMYAINMGLPWVSRVIPLTATKEAIQVNFPYATSAGMDLLNSKIGDILLEVTNKVGDHGLIDGWVDKQGRNLFLLREKSAMGLFAVADSIIIALIIAIGVIIIVGMLGGFWIISRHDSEVSERARLRDSRVNQILEDPTLTPEEKENLIDAYYQGEKKVMQQETKIYDIFDIIKWSILIAAIGVGGYYLSKGIIKPLIKKEG